MTRELLDPIDHVAINVADLGSALQWYRSSFACEVLYHDATQAILQFRNIKLVLVLPSQQPPHLAYPRSDADTLGSLKQQPDGSSSTFISDASGNPVEIIAADSLPRGGGTS